MTATTNNKSLRQYKIRFYLIVEQTLTFPSSFNMVREVKKIIVIIQKIYIGVIYKVIIVIIVITIIFRINFWVLQLSILTRD